MASITASVTVRVETELAKEKGVNYAILFSVIEDLIESNREQDGFAAVSADDIYNFTGLTRRQQDLVIKKMVEEGVLIVEKKGIPCRRYFKLVSEEK